MIIHHRWLTEGRVAYFDVEGDVNFDDLVVLNNTILNYLHSGTDGEVHCVFATGKMGSYPSNIFKVNNLMTFNRDPQMGWLFLITQNRAINFISTATSQFASARYKTIDSLDEAYPILEKMGLKVTTTT